MALMRSRLLLRKKYYCTPGNREPAREYIQSLDTSARARIFTQIDRAKIGNIGHGHGVGNVQELVIDYGPGYRVYYSVVENGEMLLLLVVGDKSSQRSDIRIAEQYLQDYWDRLKGK